MDYNAFIDDFNQRDKYSANTGIRLTHVAPGEAKATLEFSDGVKNYMGAMHGGALYTLADIVTGCAVAAYGYCPVTLDADIRYLAPVTGGVVNAQAKVVKKGRQVCVIRADIADNTGRLCCTATVSMFLTNVKADSCSN